MNDTPTYKSLKVAYATWQAITRISATTGEPRTQIIDRLVASEEDRLKSTGSPQKSPQTRAE